MATHTPVCHSLQPMPICIIEYFELASLLVPIPTGGYYVAYMIQRVFSVPSAMWGMLLWMNQVLCVVQQGSAT